MTNATAKKYGLKSDRRPEEGRGLQVRRLPGVPDAQHVLRRLHEAVRAHERDVRRRSASVSAYAALDAGTVLAADVFSTDPPLGKGSKYTVLADPKHVTGFQNVAPIVKTSVATGRRLDVHEHGQRGLGEADADRDRGDEQGGDRRQAVAGGGRQGVPARRTGSSSLRVVVLGGGSSGEHFVGALRRLDARRGADARRAEARRRRVLVLGLHADEDDAARARARRRRRRAPRRQRRRARSAARCSPGATSSPSGTTPRRSNGSTSQSCELVRGDARGRQPGRRHGRRAGAAVRPAGDRDRLVTGDPADPGIEGVDYWTNNEATETTRCRRRWSCSAAGPSGASSPSSSRAWARG